MTGKMFALIVAGLLVVLGGVVFLFLQSGKTAPLSDTSATAAPASSAAPQATGAPATDQPATPGDATASVPAQTGGGAQAANEVAALLSADSATRGKNYSTYGGTYYRADQVATDPTNPITNGDGFHKYVTSPQAAQELPFISQIPTGVTAFQLSAVAPSGKEKGKLYLTVQTEDGQYCDQYYFGWDEAGTPAAVGQFTCGPFTERTKEGVWIGETFLND